MSFGRFVTFVTSGTSWQGFVGFLGCARVRAVSVSWRPGRFPGGGDGKEDRGVADNRQITTAKVGGFVGFVGLIEQHALRGVS